MEEGLVFKKVIRWSTFFYGCIKSKGKVTVQCACVRVYIYIYIKRLKAARGIFAVQREQQREPQDTRGGGIDPPQNGCGLAQPIISLAFKAVLSWHHYNHSFLRHTIKPVLYLAHTRTHLLCQPFFLRPAHMCSLRVDKGSHSPFRSHTQWQSMYYKTPSISKATFLLRASIGPRTNDDEKR